MSGLVGRVQGLIQRKFVRDTIALQLTTAVQGVSYLITSVLTARYLGDFDLGRWATTRETYMIAFLLVSLGLVNATISKYAQAVGAQDRRAAVDALAALLKIGMVTSLVVVALGRFVAPWFARRYLHDEQFATWTFILCFSGFFEVLRGLAMTALHGTRQMRLWAELDIASSLLRVGLVWGALVLDRGIEPLVWAFVVHMAATGALSLLVYGRARRTLDPSHAPPPLAEVVAAIPGAPIGHVFRLGWLMALNKQMDTLVPRLGLLFIPALAAASEKVEAYEANGAYQVAHVLSWALALALGGVAKSLLPALGMKIGQDGLPFERMGGLLRRITLISGGLMTLAVAAAIPVMHAVIQVFYGPEFSDAFELFCWLAIGNVFLGFSVVVDSFYIYSGRMNHALPQNLIYASLATAGIYFGTAHFGPKGAAAAAGLCRAFGMFHLVYIWAYFRRVRGASQPP